MPGTSWKDDVASHSFSYCSTAGARTGVGIFFLGFRGLESCCGFVFYWPQQTDDWNDCTSVVVLGFCG